MAIAIDPTIATRAHWQRVDVALEGEHDRGCTRIVGDHAIALTEVIWEADEQRFKSMIMAMCASR